MRGTSTGRSRRGRSQDGFNEDRRICPIKMSCKDPARSIHLVHSQNIEIRHHRNNLFLSATAIYTRTLGPLLSLSLSRFVFRESCWETSLREFRDPSLKNWTFSFLHNRIDIYIYIYISLRIKIKVKNFCCNERNWKFKYSRKK